jgi:hypothetical protein
MIVPIEIQCGCGQRYAFDTEPVNGRLGAPVACPSCGADGTAAANSIIAQALTAQSPSPLLARPSSNAPPTISGKPIEGMQKLKWYEEAWIALPIALVAVGGALGGLCGALAWGLNRLVFMKLEPPAIKYVVTGLISVCAVIVWLILALFVLALLKK